MAPVPHSAQYIGGDFREDRDLMDAQIVLGFEGRAYHMRDFYASQLLSMILGGGMSSRLFQEIREKRGLCYSIYAFHWGFSDTGAFGVHAATGNEDVEDLIPLILSELDRVSEEITQEEIDRARAQYRAGLVLAAESPSSRAGQLARQLLLYGRPIPREELMERLGAITRERLTDLAGRLFSGRPTLAAIGPVSGLVPFDAVAGRNGLATEAMRRRAV
jgi:predicted Zn-dependent peptidase